MAGNQVVISVEEGQQVLAESVKPEDAGAGATEQTEEGSSALDELKSKFHQLKNKEKKRPQTEKGRFPKIAKMLGSELGDSADYYKPKIISLGPYHHGKPNLKKGETIKLKLAAAYFELIVKTVDDFYKEIEGIIKDLKDLYDEGWTKKYSNAKFTVMMLVDGCSLLHYMLCVCSGSFEEDLKIRYQDLSHLNRDTLLLENQLPFQLLIKLWPFKPDFLMKMCQEFIRMNNRDPFLQEHNFYCGLYCFQINQIINRQPQQSWQLVDEEDKPCHFLDLFRSNILGDKGSSRTDTEDQCLKEDDGARLNYSKNVDEAMKGDFLSFRNVKELMAAGIRIKQSHTSCLKDISFTSNGITACLRLPPITINNSTKTLFLNLIAYEMTSNVPRDFISYLRFLDSLVDHADDVKELQSAGVLQNNLGTHEKVAEFFNTVSANLEPNFHAYKDVRVKIRKHLRSHYNSRLKMWMTQCLDTYFGSPWTIIAWVGAALALFFTAVQTYFSVFPH